MRADAIFIAIEVDDEAAQDPELAGRLSQVCPVDIYRASEGDGVEIVEEHIDECVLCRLCIEAAPDGAVRVLKRYDDDAPL